MENKPKKQYGTKPTDTCERCQKIVYPTEKLMLKKNCLHRNCFRCEVCNKILDLATYATVDDRYFCKPHFTQLYNVNGDYTTGFAKVVPVAQPTGPSVSTAEVIEKSLPQVTVPLKLKDRPESEPQPKLSVKEHTQTFEKQDEKAQMEMEGKLDEDAYDQHGNVILKTKVTIDPSEETKLKRVNSWHQLKTIVDETEKMKHKLSELVKVSQEDIAQKQLMTEQKRANAAKLLSQTPTESCQVCNKTVYPAEKVVAEKLTMHVDCLRCIECSKKLTITTYNAWNKQFYCKPHFNQLDKSKPLITRSQSRSLDKLSNQEPAVTLNDALNVTKTKRVHFDENLPALIKTETLVAESSEEEFEEDESDIESLSEMEAAQQEVAKSDQTQIKVAIQVPVVDNPNNHIKQKVKVETQMELDPEVVVHDDDELDGDVVKDKDLPTVPKNKSAHIHNPLITPTNDAVAHQKHGNPLYDRTTFQTTSNMFKTITKRVHRFTAADWQTERSIMERIGFDFVIQESTDKKNKGMFEAKVSSVPQPLFDMMVDDDGNIVTNQSGNANVNEVGLQVGDILLEVNGRRLTNMRKNQILTLLKNMLKPLPGQALPKKDAQDELSDQSIVILNWIVCSRQLGLKLSYALSSGKFKYNEIRLLRIDPLNMLKSLDKAKDSPWTLQTAGVKSKPPPDQFQSIGADSEYPYFTFDFDIASDASYSQKLNMDPQEMKQVPPCLTVCKLKRIPHDLVKSLAESQGRDTSTPIHKLLPPIYKVIQGELRINDLIWKWNDEVIAFAVPSELKDTKDVKLLKWQAMNDTQRSEVRTKLKKNGIDHIKNSHLQEEVCLGVVVPNKLHPDLKSKEECSVM